MACLPLWPFYLAHQNPSLLFSSAVRRRQMGLALDFLEEQLLSALVRTHRPNCHVIVICAREPVSSFNCCFMSTISSDTEDELATAPDCVGKTFPASSCRPFEDFPPACLLTLLAELERFSAVYPFQVVVTPFRVCFSPAAPAGDAVACTSTCTTVQFSSAVVTAAALSNDMTAINKITNLFS